MLKNHIIKQRSSTDRKYLTKIKEFSWKRRIRIRWRIGISKCQLKGNLWRFRRRKTNELNPKKWGKNIVNRFIRRRARIWRRNSINEEWKAM